MKDEFGLPAGELLALIAVNLEPLRKCSDGLWRSATRNFPADGITENQVATLCANGLVEWCQDVAIVTDAGRSSPQTGIWTKNFPATPARAGNLAAHFSLQ